MILAAAPFFPVVACIFLLHLNPSLSFSAASISLLPVGSRDRKRESLLIRQTVCQSVLFVCQLALSSSKGCSSS